MRTIPQVGDTWQIDIERVRVLRQDLLIVWQGGNPGRQIEQLQRLGIPVFYSDPHRLEDIPASIERFGHLMGTEAQALRIFYQVSERPLYTINGRNIISDAIRQCGGRNVFADMRVTAPSVSLESVLKENPEVVFNSSVEARQPVQYQSRLGRPGGAADD